MPQRCIGPHLKHHTDAINTSSLQQLARHMEQGTLQITCKCPIWTVVKEPKDWHAVCLMGAPETGISAPVDV